MDCNKDEALCAKEIAEKKFEAKDIVGARKFALKARDLFPALEGINQMIATLDVYFASEQKNYDEKDWYSILNASPSANEETLKKQYRKLALQLHPDKNKCIGAEGAFKLISEAWSVLSDKTKKTIYDQKRNAKGFYQKYSQPNQGKTFHSSDAQTAADKAKISRSNGSTAASTTVHQPPKTATFWTSCNRCRIQYEYLRMYLNHNLCCPNCNKPFLATELKNPPNRPTSNTPFPGNCQPQFGSGNNSRGRERFIPVIIQNGARKDSSTNQDSKSGSFRKTTEARHFTGSSAAIAAQFAKAVREKSDKVTVQATARKEEVVHRKSNSLKRDASSSGISHAGPSEKPTRKKRNISNGFNDYAWVSADESCSSETIKVNGVPADGLKSRTSSKWNHLVKEVSRMDTRSMLIDMAKSEIDNKLEEWKSAEAAKINGSENASKKSKKEHDTEKEKKTICKATTANQDKSDVKMKKRTSKSLPDKQAADSENENSETVSIEVPDPDFHNFDNNRSEQSFGSDEMWAIYDEEDGMPRYYALVQKVISSSPFKVRMSFLTSKSNSEFGSLNWVASGFPKTCGEFRISRYEMYDTINSFSHKVKWEKGPRGVIKIVPRKGEIWALYKNWSPSWNEHTPDEIIYKYEMVEVLEDYDKGQGVQVTLLEKVAGFKTVFRRDMDPFKITRIQNEEMFRFSHQVPSCVLTGEEAQNAPKGCYELDPAATPLDLIQLAKETKSNMDMKAKLSLGGK